MPPMPPTTPTTPMPPMPPTTPTKKPAKSRILHLARILAEETDPEHGLTLPEIQDHLAAAGVPCERKSLYRDLDALAEAGIEVGRLRTRPVSYYLATRPFEPAQMTLLVDAVQTSRSITKGNSATLIRKLKKLASRHQAKGIDARVHVAGRVKMQSESIFRDIDLIQRAIAERRDISFSYVRYDVTKQLRDVAAHDGRDRVRTPLFLVYGNESYYLLAYDAEAADRIRSYRVDRMRSILLLGKSDKAHRAPAGFDIAAYEKQAIGMYGGKPQIVKLLVAEEVVGSVIDLFGADDVECSEAEGVREAEGVAEGSRRWAHMRVKVAPSAVFFGRIAQFGGDVRIAHPKSVVAAFEEHLERTLAAQRL